ncbi:hypothetical protein GJR93_31095 [Aminobacter sp. MDW-2]|jgi:hypothetical protein|uniref:hypothetical protein n=1 Tax=Aminobacter ciceronei TaxID=150723 RepID=UPI00130F7BD8|nr:hypothetical protein [Aminobacter ciceronei]MRX37459.1 hypothetical protein [Aminobacter sp. MDW-2]
MTKTGWTITPLRSADQCRVSMTAQLQVTGSNDQRECNSIADQFGDDRWRPHHDRADAGQHCRRNSDMTAVEVNIRTSSRHQEMLGQLPPTRPIKAITRGAT